VQKTKSRLAPAFCRFSDACYFAAGAATGAASVAGTAEAAASVAGAAATGAAVSAAFWPQADKDRANRAAIKAERFIFLSNLTIKTNK